MFDNVKFINSGAFYACENLNTIVFSTNLIDISDEAFYATDLTSVTIPDSVTSIGNYAFAYCDSLTIYCEAESEPDGWDSSWNYSNCPVVWGYTADAE